MSSFDLLPELAAALDRVIPPTPGFGDWSDVLRRAEPRRGSRRSWPPLRFAWALGVLLFVVVAVAAAYVILSHQASGRPRPGALTVTAGGYNTRWPVRIIEVLPHGRTTVVWKCPAHAFCGEPEGIDWSPDGRHVAFTLASFNTPSRYLGLHVLDIKSGRNLVLFRQHDWANQRSLDCPSPAAVAWSPDGRTLAFDCAAFNERSRIWLVDANGSHRRRVPVGHLDASWPSWSPDGTRLAFAATKSGARNGIYTVGVDGSGLRRAVGHGSAPDWSPDGREIAFNTATGIELITPSGRDVTPSHQRRVGPAGAPAWSPDGKQLAIGAAGGGALYLVDAHGRHLRKVAIRGDVGSLGPRPAWYPITRTTSSSHPTTGCQSC